MDITQLQPNSKKSREEAKSTEVSTREKRVQKVVSGPVKTKKNEGRKLADIFISEDVSNVKEFLFKDVIVPGLKSLVTTMLRDGLDMLFYGRTTGGSSSNGRAGSAPKISYRNYYDNPRDNIRDNRGYESKARFEYEDIVFSSIGEAESVLRHMQDTIGRFGIVSVGDMYDLVGLGDNAPHTAFNYGWTNLRNAEPCRVREGYIIRLPKAMPFD